MKKDEIVSTFIQWENLGHSEGWTQGQGFAECFPWGMISAQDFQDVKIMKDTTWQDPMTRPNDRSNATIYLPQNDKWVEETTIDGKGFNRFKGTKFYFAVFHSVFCPMLRSLFLNSTLENIISRLMIDIIQMIAGNSTGIHFIFLPFALFIPFHFSSFLFKDLQATVQNNNISNIAPISLRNILNCR